MNFLRIGLVCFFWGGFVSLAHSQEWLEEKSKHFSVEYRGRADLSTAQKILRDAESYYSKVGDLIGYTRYSDFWTWDQRVQIYFYPDKVSFMKETGQPEWSTGVSASHQPGVTQRAIASFKQSQDFFDGLLPHEVSHLVLHDFVGDLKKLPLWFDEGVAQFQEAKKSEIADRMMRSYIAQGQYVHLDSLMTWNVREEKDQTKVNVFYGESVSLINFLIKKYGSSAFNDLCRHIRDGLPFEMALQKAYTNQLNNLQDLEDKWLRTMK